MTTANTKSTPFQIWLRKELDDRDWSNAKLGREIDVFKGTIGRWLVPVDSPMYRVPSYENCRRLARVFGVDLGLILQMAGIEDEDTDVPLTKLQRNAVSVIHRLPDDVLDVVYPQLLALLEKFGTPVPDVPNPVRNRPAIGRREK